MVFNGIDCFNDCIYLSCGNYIITVSLNCLSKAEIWTKQDKRLSSVARNCQYLMTSLSCDGNTFVVFDNCQCLKFTCCLPCEYRIQDISCCNDCIYILVSKYNCHQFVLICHLQSHCHNKPCQQGCTDIIESIALIETSLSHILNAEGEKLQKIIACSDEPDVILEVNDAVNRTITNITHLEHVLYSKLETAKCLCEKKKK